MRFLPLIFSHKTKKFMESNIEIDLDLENTPSKLRTREGKKVLLPTYPFEKKHRQRKEK